MDSSRSAVRELDARGPAAIGRDARVELEFERRGARSVLVRGYAEPPFRIGRVFDIDDAAYLILVCSGPGVFGGDTLRQTVRVGRGARVVLTSQAALQIHPAAAAGPDTCRSATLQSQFVVDEGAELHCHWDPVIPFADARLDQRFDIRVEESSRFYWSDAIMSGRVSRGEAWRFQRLAHELSVQVGGALRYLERYALSPAERAVDRAWIAGSAHYFATTLVSHREASSGIAEDWQRAGAAFPGVRTAVDLAAPCLVAARVAAADGAAFARTRTWLRARALDDIFRAPELAGRK